MPRPMPRCDSPQAWNSGAAMTTVSRARIGHDRQQRRQPVGAARRRAHRALRPAGRPRRQDDHPAGPPGRTAEGPPPLGRERRRSRAAGTVRRAPQPDDDVGVLVVVEDHVDALVGDHVGQLRTGEPGVQEHDVGAELRRGHEADTKPRSLRARIPTVLPGPTPRRRRFAATPSWRCHSSVKSSAPSPSISAGACGYLAVAAATTPAIVGPHAANANIARGSRSGRSGRSAARARAAAAAASSRGGRRRHQPARRRRARGRRPRSYIVSHSACDEVREHEQVVDLAGLAAHVVLEEALGLEAEAGEHGHRRLLLGDDLDDELGHAQLDGLDDGPLGEQAAEPAAACSGSTTRRSSPTWALHADAGDDRDVPRPRRRRSPPAGAGRDRRASARRRRARGRPRGRTCGRPRAPSRRSARTASASRGSRARTSTSVRRPVRSPITNGSAWRSSQSAIAGRLRRWAGRPTIEADVSGRQPQLLVSVGADEATSARRPPPAGRCGPSRR